MIISSLEILIKRFIKISSELIIINNLQVNDSIKVLLYNNTFKKHEIPSSKYLETLTHYQEQPQKWVDIYNKIKGEIEEKDSKKEK